MKIIGDQNSFIEQTTAGRLPVGILTCNFDADFTVEEVNEGFFEMTGYTPIQLEGQFQNRLMEMVPPADRQEVLKIVSKQFLNNAFISFPCRILCKNGLYKRVVYRGRFMHGEGDKEQLFGIMEEETADKIIHERDMGNLNILSPFLRKHDHSLSRSGIMLFEWDIASDTLLYSHNWNQESGFAPAFNQSCRQDSLRRRIHPDDLFKYTELLTELREGSVYATAEFRIFNSRNAYIWCQAHAVTLYNQDEKPVKAVGIFFNIDEQKRAMEELKARAEQDALTGLYNKNETEKQIKAYLDDKPQESCALFMIDTDNFKQVNDTEGHMLGDSVLKELAQGLKKNMRDNDVVGRIGGDEFTVFMKNITEKEAVQKAEELSGIFRHLFEHEKHSVQITCSIGVAMYPSDGNDFQALYKCADQALYRAKSQGKDGYVLYGKENFELSDEIGYSSLGAVIESQTTTTGVSRELLTYLFKLLYKAEDIEQAVNRSLEVVGKWFDVSRAYIFETGESGDFYRNTYEWCSEGIEPEIGNLQHLDLETAGDYRELFGADSIYYCRNTHELPPIQRKLFEDQSIHSFLQYALWEKETFAGFIGFDECTGLRLWTQEEVNTLSQFSELLDTFLQKKKIKEWLQKAQQLTRDIIEQDAEFVFVIAKDTYRVLFTGRNMKKLVPGLEPGVLCYKALYYTDRPCSFCPLNGGPVDSLQNNRCMVPRGLPVAWGNEAAEVICFHHIDEKTAGRLPSAAEGGSPQQTAERSIIDCIQCLTTSEYLEDAIEYVLRIIMEYYQSDRVYIIEADEEHGTGSNTYEVCADGVEPQIDHLQNVPIEAISFWMKQFTIRDYIRIDDVEELGPDRQMEYEVLKAQGVKSLMALPLYVKEEIKGFLGIDDPKANTDNFHYLEELTYFIENEITKNSMRKRLERISYEDPLTGLENRNSYMAYCDEFSRRQPVPAGIIFMDINGLKKLNSERGHVYGDMVITHVGDVMKRFFPEGRKFRLSGDEFLIVTDSVTYDDFQKQLNQMEAKLTVNGSSFVSVGTIWSDVRTELTELMNKAEQLMHIRKQDYYKGYKEIAAKKMPLLKDVTDSLTNKQYMIYLQPQFHMKTGKVDQAEVLVRYREKDGSVSSPIKFIPLLEREGLISYIDFFVMDEACRLLNRWKNTEFADMKLSLNFSRITLFDKNFLSEFMRIFKSWDIRPEQLEIEITESQETLNKKQMVLLLEELKAHHFKIALDDFGVEYSSYEFLMMASFDLLKIDKGIIQKYEEAAKGKTLVRHMVDMGHSIGADCCAEGVETEEQFEYMKEIGCDYVQGYLIDKPIPVERFEMKLKSGGY